MITAHVFIAISLDGFIARDDGDISWLLDRDDPTEDHGYTAFIADKDAIVMGRGSYEKALTFDSWPYRPVFPDAHADPATVTRAVLCSGKLYYDLVAARQAAGAGHVAIVRVEELYPLHADELRAALAAYRPGLELVWAQEEPANMGAWDYVAGHLSPRLPRPLELVARPASASPAVGSSSRHKLEQEQLVREALGEPIPRLERAEPRAAVGAGAQPPFDPAH